MDLLKVMAALYDSEINCAIWSFWDGGFTAGLGDEVNGWKGKASFWAPSLEKDSDWLAREGWREMGQWLQAAAIEHYPDSDCAKTWQGDRT